MGSEMCIRDRGLVYHWNVPNLMDEDLRWLVAYVALSRPRSLAEFVCVGLTNKQKEMIEGGPPEGIPRKFSQLFDETLASTLNACEKARF